MSQHSDELIKLRAALAPFARRADFLDPETDDSVSYWHPAVGSVVTAGDLRRARAVLDEAAKPAPGGPKMREGWQPIETAPKDGRDFLVWNRENRVRKARWYERSSSDLGISLYEGDGVNSFKGGIQPTHWMPLPAPPEPIVPEVPARVDGEGE